MAKSVVYRKGYRDAYKKLGEHSGVRLDSGTGAMLASLRKKYIDAGWDAESARIFSNNAAGKLWKERDTWGGGVPGYHAAVKNFKAPPGIPGSRMVGRIDYMKTGKDRSNMKKTAEEIADEVLRKCGSVWPYVLGAGALAGGVGLAAKHMRDTKKQIPVNETPEQAAKRKRGMAAYGAMFV